MRPLELLLAITTTVALLLVLVARPDVRGWAGPVGMVALLTLCGQTLAEGARWQMVPLYTVATTVALISVRRRAAEHSTATGSVGSRWATLGCGGLATVSLAISVAVPICVPVFRLPDPGGPYGIGTVIYHWIDADRPEVFTSDPADRRELMVQVWYPARIAAETRRPYVPDPDTLAPAMAELLHLPELAFGHLDDVATHAMPSAPMSDAEPRYPLLLFLSGLSGFRQSNTVQVEHLVSHGYVVAAIDQPYAAAGVRFPDGRAVGYDARMSDPAFMYGKVRYLADDVSFTISRLFILDGADPDGLLTGRLDIHQTGVFGVSLGGIVAGVASASDPRLKACLIQDAPLPADLVPAGLSQPAMWISRDAATMYQEGWSRDAVSEHQATMRAVFEKLPGDGYLVLIPDMYHLDLTDAPRWSPVLSWLGATGPIGADRVHGLINRYSLGFFDRHLRGLPAAALEETTAEQGGVVLEFRR